MPPSARTGFRSTSRWSRSNIPNSASPTIRSSVSAVISFPPSMVALFKAPAGRKGWGHHLQQSHHLERADQLHARTRDDGRVDRISRTRRQQRPSREISPHTAARLACRALIRCRLAVDHLAAGNELSSGRPRSRPAVAAENSPARVRRVSPSPSVRAVSRATARALPVSCNVTRREVPRDLENGSGAHRDESNALSGVSRSCNWVRCISAQGA